MRKFWKGAGRVAALTIGAKVIAELVKCCRKRRDCPETKLLWILRVLSIFLIKSLSGRDRGFLIEIFRIGKGKISLPI
jgi:hypothetical protein